MIDFIRDYLTLLLFSTIPLVLVVVSVGVALVLAIQMHPVAGALSVVFLGPLCAVTLDRVFR